MWRILFSIFCLTCYVSSQIITQRSTPLIRSAISAAYDDDTQSLYFTSINTTGQQSSIFRYSERDGVLYSAYIEGVNSPAFIYPVSKKCKKCKKLFIVGIGSQVVTIEWNGKSTRAKVVNELFGLDTNIPTSRTGRAKIFPHGRFYGGTFSDTIYCNQPADLSFYRYDSSNGLVRLFGNLVSTTGIALNENAGKLYHLDSCTYLLTEFDWDPETGDICNGRVAFDFKLYSNLLPLNYPLSLEIDSNGMLYTAQPQAVWIINPWTSSLVRTIDFPAPVLNGIAFGGPRKDTLYVIAAPDYFNIYNQQVVADPTNTTTSLYALTGLGAVGTRSERFQLH